MKKFEAVRIHFLYDIFSSLILDELPVHVSYQNIPVICIKEERRKGYCHLENVLCHVVCEVCVLHDKFLVFREAFT